MTEPVFHLPQAFRAAGIRCGIKDTADALDLALFVSDRRATAAGVFTQNRVVGAPVKVSRARVPRDTARAVVINSGNANACTGERGDADAAWMTATVADQFGWREEDVLVCSTGIIGHFLPREKLEQGLPQAAIELSDAPESFHRAAKAMMTTDTVTKQAVRELEIEGKAVRISGAAKGAAMIGPNMATMLAVVMTDAILTTTDADRMLRNAVNQSFNCISVEGHTSTSDTVILLANGAAGVGPTTVEQKQQFLEAFDDLTAELARAIISDAEGASHLITIDVTGLASDDDAHRVAKTVADSALVKTAVAGADPNWGRIVSAAGYSGVEFQEQQVSLKLNGTSIYESGAPVAYDEEALSTKMRESRDVHMELTFTLGNGSARFWTSDLTTEYVRLNSEYTT